MTENPENRRPLRRHASLHPRLQRHSSLLSRKSSLRSRLSKSNPYVGSFRHAPSVSTRDICSLVWKEGNARQRIQLCVSSRIDLKNSPHVGWFRHAPPSRFLHLPKGQCALLEKEITSLLIKNKVVWADGHLRGGSPGSNVPLMNELPSENWLETEKFSRNLRRALKESSAGSQSATVRILTRLATWLIFPPDDDNNNNNNNNNNSGDIYDLAEDKKRAITMFSHLHEMQSVAASDGDSSTECGREDDDDDASSISSDGTHLNAAMKEDGPSVLTVSSLAEAYYAHQLGGAPASPDQSLHSSTYDSDPHRLDYVITQMDIARMARNASRHLDVESILNLPTTTYRSISSTSSPEPSASEHEGGEEAGWSWMIVPPAGQELEDEQDVVKNKNSCVICMEHFVDGDRLRVLPCNHAFHVGCIDRWLSGSHSFEECYTSGCPVCKKSPNYVEPSMDGSVPSWAFERLGDVLSNQT